MKPEAVREKSILLVDDEVLLRETYCRELTENHYAVTTAADGKDAIDRLKGNHFDMVITDLIMPETDGITVLREAKRIDPEICVFLMTAYGNRDSAIEALRLEADDYLLKPCNTEELLLRIKQSLRKQEAIRKVKLRSNIITLCMYCKSIQDDSSEYRGNDRWMVMEDFFFRKCGLQVSHGCCSKCLPRALHGVDKIDDN